MKLAVPPDCPPDRVKIEYFVANPEFDVPPTDAEVGDKFETEQPSAPVKALKLTYFDSCISYVDKDWLFKGAFAVGETSGLIGPPGAGKSALVAEITVHGAGRREWRGHKAKKKSAWVIFALERGDLYRRRLDAYRQRDGAHNLPIAVCDASLDLLNPTCVEIVKATIDDAKHTFDMPVSGIVIDTYSKGIAAGGGDEDKARDQNRAAANLRKLHSERPLHILLVGHTGKQEDRGARGSNAHLGDVDLMIQISGDDIKTAQVTKANDQPLRTLAEFRLEQFELGRDEDGDPITTAIVSTEQFEMQNTINSKPKKSDLPAKSAASLKALFECVADGASSAPTDPHVPRGVTGVTLDIWRDRLLKTALINAEGNPRQEFKRIHVTLKERGFIGIWDGFVWPVT